MCDNIKQCRPWCHWAGYGALAVLFAWLLLGTDFSAFWRQLRRLPVWLLLVLIALQLLTQLLITYQWHRLTYTVLGRSQFSKILHIFTRGSVVEAITPGAKIGGEAVRLYLLKKEFSCPTHQAISIIAIQKSMSMSVLLTICLVSLLHIGRRISHHLPLSMQLLSGGVCLFLVVAMVGLLFFARPLSSWLQQHHSHLAQRIGAHCANYAAATGQLTRRQWCLHLAISTAVWLLFPLKMVILAGVLHVRLPFVVLLSVTMVSYMMGLFPLTPGGIGTFEGTMLALLSLLGVGYTLGLTITLVFRFVTFWLVVLASLTFVLLYEFHLKLKGGQLDDQSPLDSQLT